MKAKHTPGPWSSDADGALVVVGSGRDAGRVIAELARGDGRSVGGTKKMDAAMLANARLIAAAPDLLAALCELVEAVEDNGRDSLRQLLAAHEAIAKALPPNAALTGLRDSAGPG